MRTFRRRGIAVYLVTYGPEDLAGRIARELDIPVAHVFANAVQFNSFGSFVRLIDRETAHANYLAVVLAKMRSLADLKDVKSMAVIAAHGAAAGVTTSVSLVVNLANAQAVSASAARPEPAAAAAADAAWQASLDDLSYALSPDYAENTRFVDEWMAERRAEPRFSGLWWWDTTCRLTAYAVTGSATVALVRPALVGAVGLQGSMRDGPWSYRIGSVVLVAPAYSAVLLLVGSLFGQHAFFKRAVLKMANRLTALFGWRLV